MTNNYIAISLRCIAQMIDQFFSYQYICTVKNTDNE